MLSFITSLFRGLDRSRYINAGHEAVPSSDLTRELEDLRKFSLNSLMMFLGVHLVAGSKALGPLTLALLIYTISLHLAIGASFLQNCPTLSRFLHAVPFLGISGMAVVELVMGVQSPALAVGGLLVGALPLLIIAIYHARSSIKRASMRLPVRVHEVARHVSGSTETIALSS
ncbi:hypothetical protein OG21DRAFT_1485068 [Imleria badia]|nr:hypothetical protein OG21DRAFT_1485068 [Imleria badia]